MNATQALQNIVRLGLDTAPVIYYVENVSNYFALCEPFFTAIDANQINAFTSTITLTETLAHPLRTGNQAFADQFRNLLLATPGIATEDLTPAIAERAADLRAHYNLRTPDAVQVATAIETNCDAFLTNDAALKRVTEIRIIVVGELMA